MRVLQIANSVGLQSGGAERLAHDLHLDLLDDGVDAHILALEACDLGQLPQARSLGMGSSYDPRTPFALLRAIREVAPDLIHAHLFPTSAHLAVLKALGRIKVPLIFTEHNTSNRRRDMMTGKWIDPKIYRAYDRIYCISEGTKNELIKAFPDLKHKVEVIANGARLRFDAIPDRRREAPVKLLAIGRLHVQKNFEALLDAVGRLPRGLTELTILGEGALRDQLERQASALNIMVRLEGHVSDPKPFLAKADIFVVPSSWEGFGLAAVEAMNAGLPIVASDVAGLREVVGVDGGCALLVDPDNTETISQAIQRLIEDRALADELGQNGFQRAQLFDKSQMARSYKTAYEALIGGTDT